MNLKMFMLCVLCFLNLTFFAQESEPIPTKLSIGISTSLLLSGEQNATYDINHALQIGYTIAFSEKIAFLPQVSYLNSPYNQNFKMIGLQLMGGMKYELKGGNTSFLLLLGYERTRESYAFKFQESVTHGSLSNSGMVLKGAASFALVKKLRCQPFIEFIPNLRTGAGICLSYHFTISSYES